MQNRSILDIYDEYKIMPNLKEHMLKVTAVAKIIISNFDKKIEIDEEKLITGALFHDMGNIIKFNLDKFPSFNEPKGKDYWSSIKEEYIRKYGKDEHKATVLIMEKIGIRKDIIEIVENMIFGALCKHSSIDTSFEMKILHYADMRVGPFGILSYEDRMNDVKERYKDVPDDEFNKVKYHDREKLLFCGKEIEKQIFSYCSIKPEDINDDSLKDIINELKNFIVKI